MAVVREGELKGGLPYLAFGEGPPLVVFPGLGPHNGNPTGLSRRLELSTFSVLAERFTIFDVNRRPGLTPGTTIKDKADSYAEEIRGEFSGPVDVLGLSTGGSIAQRFAADHPTLVRRLVLLISGYRLSVAGRAAQRSAHWRSAARRESRARRGPQPDVRWPLRPRPPPSRDRSCGCSARSWPPRTRPT